MDKEEGGADQTSPTQVHNSCAQSSSPTHEDGTPPPKLEWGGVDLILAAKEVLRFLDILDARKDLGELETLRQVKVQYIKFLNLVHKYPSEFLVPPFEVEAFWQTHLIRPDMYEADCNYLFGELIPHRIETCRERAEEGRGRARELWELAYSEDESANTTPLPEELEEKVKHLRVKEEDVIEDRQWYPYFKMYTYNVTDWDTYLPASRQNYLTFLYMCATDNGEFGFMEPTYAMDLIWHCHMFHPNLYVQHSKILANRLLVHVPWPKVCTVEEMYAGLDRMDQRWKQQFGRSMHDLTQTN
jgi:hypothetical protein